MKPSLPFWLQHFIMPALLAHLKLKIYFKTRFGGLRARLWRPQGSILKGLGMLQGRFWSAQGLFLPCILEDVGSHILGHMLTIVGRLSCLLLMGFPRLATQLDKCGAELLPWNCFLFCYCLSSKGLDLATSLGMVSDVSSNVPFYEPTSTIT